MAFFFLTVVTPLFFDGSVEARARIDRPWEEERRVLAGGSDPYERIAWSLLDDGELRIFSLGSGGVMATRLFGEGERAVTALAQSPRGDSFAVGYDDGSVQTAVVRFETRYFPLDAFDGKYGVLPPGETREVRWTEEDEEGEEVALSGVVELGKAGLLRMQVPALELGPRKKLAKGVVEFLHHTFDEESGSLFVAAGIRGEEGLRLAFARAEERESMATGEVTLKFLRTKFLELVPEDVVEGDPPIALKLASKGRHLLVLHASGRGLRFRIGRSLELAERFDLLEDPQERLSAADMLLGGETLLAGSDRGRIEGWFLAPLEPESVGFDLLRKDGQAWLFRSGSTASRSFRRAGTLEDFVEREAADITGASLRAVEDAVIDDWLALRTTDGFRLIQAKSYRAAGDGSAILRFNSSARGRDFAALDRDGTLAFFQATTEVEFASTRFEESEPVDALCITPKGEGMLSFGSGGVQRWKLDPGFASVTLSSLFLPVWYEGFPAPQHTWQSSETGGGSEPKMGLWPLVFGTLKATFYSMLFGIPIALLAAIYTSEFLSHKAKARIKPTIELMASLPSVVLGFLAALVFAPFVENFLAAIFALIVTLPFTLLLGAYLWQLLPRETIAKYHGYRVPLMAVIALPLALVLAFAFLGPLMNSMFFGGEMRFWLDGANQVPVQGAAFGGWFLLLFFPCALAVGLAFGRMARRRTDPSEHRAQALASLLRFAIGTAATLLLTAAAAFLFSLVGDARGPESLFDTYIQRNALVVGFVMGFAIIPIIYTIAEDALSSVPNHLRSASLGAGATPWQTAVRIVIPTAMSGLFSACIIGLGRAVGETMIVLMAAGNTPLLELNVFNGFRTLSANIATELSEAVPVARTTARCSWPRWSSSP